MNNKRTKLIVIIVAAAAILVGAIALNIIMNGETDNELNPSASPDQGASVGVQADAVNYFVQYRAEREERRALDIEILNAIISNEATDAETMADAQEQLMEIVDCMEKEQTIEDLLKAKGFNDSAVTFHYGSVNVIIDCDEITTEQIAQILDIVRRETGEPAGNIKVSPKG